MSLQQMRPENVNLSETTSRCPRSWAAVASRTENNRH